jgi:hypothetical protein
MSIKTKFGFPNGTLVHYGEHICDAGEAHPDINTRLPANFIADTRALVNTVNAGTADQKGRGGAIGTLTEQQDNARLAVEDWLAKARASAKRAFTNKVKLHEEFQVGAATSQTLGALLERSRIVLASCQEPANAAALQAKGWLPADTTALAAAITALDDVDDTQETAKDGRVGATSARNAQANQLYDNLLTIQNAANLQWPASDAANIAIRGEFELETFPKDARATPVPKTYTAAGFGAAQANGLLTERGTFAGKPYYQIAGGWWVYWHVALNSWEIGATDPNEDQDRKYNSAGDIPAPTGAWVGDGGDAPAGTITAS